MFGDTSAWTKFNMQRTGFYIAACLIAAIAPLFAAKPKAVNATTVTASFAGWPEEFEGKKLSPMQMTEREAQFGRDFPGHIGRFTDGRREIIIRWVPVRTLNLHSAAGCLQAIGYHIEPLPLHIDESGNKWETFRATRGGEKLLIHERIFAEGGSSWPDVSAWYWGDDAGSSSGPWWAITTAEKE